MEDQVYLILFGAIVRRACNAREREKEADFAIWSCLPSMTLLAV
jgi:hypothetical protein